MKLKYKLPLLTTLLLMGAFIILWLGAQQNAFDFTFDAQRKIAMANIESQTHELEHEIRQGNDVLQFLENKARENKFNWDLIKDSAYEKLGNSPFDKIGLVYRDRSYHITGTEKIGDISDRQYLNDAFKGELVVSEPIYSRLDGTYQIVLTHPIVEEGEVKAVLIGTILMENIEKAIYPLNLQGDGFAFLLNKNGEIILHPKADILPKENFFESLDGKKFQSSNGYVQYRGVNGEKQYTFYKELGETQLYVAITVGLKHLYKPVNKLLIKNILVFSFVLSFLLIAINYVIKGTLQPIEKLIEGMKKVEEGDYTLQVEIERKDEIGEIAVQFNKTIEAICLRDEELQALNEELAASFEEINETSDKLLQAYKEISKRLQSEQLINDLGDKLYRVKDLDELLKTVLLHTEEIIGAERSIVHWLDEEGQHFEIKEALNLNGKYENTIFRKDEGTFGWVVNNKKEIVITNTKFEDEFKLKSCLNIDGNMLLQLPILDDKGEVIGIISYIGGCLNLYFTPYLKQLSKMISMAVQNSQLIGRIKKTYFDIIRALIKAMELKDSYTKGHSERVMNYSLMLGKRLGLSKKEMEILRYGSILHDIGKLGIPDQILMKESKLTEEEYRIIKTHSEQGEVFIKNLEFLQDSLSIIRNHHERIDGTGYPDQLQSEDINILVRIVTIADAYDAMTSRRAYRKALSKKQAIKELKKHKGTQFDSKLVDLFIDMISDY